MPARKYHFPARRSKFGNRKVEVDGHLFDSKAEARRYSELKIMQKVGEITDLELQPEWRLEVNGKLICRYKGDFAYTDGAGNRVVEDVKSLPTRTPQYRLKKRLMAAIHGIEISEVG